MDVGSRLTRERMRQALTEAEIAIGLAVDVVSESEYVNEDCDILVWTVEEYLGTNSELAAIRRDLALTIDLKGK